jgi:hypothetical protein
VTALPLLPRRRKGSGFIWSVAPHTGTGCYCCHLLRCKVCREKGSPASGSEAGQCLLTFQVVRLLYYLMRAVTKMDKGEWFFAAGTGYLPAVFFLKLFCWLYVPGGYLLRVHRLRRQAVLGRPSSLHRLDGAFRLSLRQRGNQLCQPVQLVSSSILADGTLAHLGGNS